MNWMKPLETRFRKRVVSGAADDCWPWLGYRNHRGYGRISNWGRRPRYLPAHRRKGTAAEDVGKVR